MNVQASSIGVPTLSKLETNYFDQLVDKAVEPALASPDAENPSWDRVHVLRVCRLSLRKTKLPEESRTRIVVAVDEFITEYQEACAARPLGEIPSSYELGATFALSGAEHR